MKTGMWTWMRVQFFRFWTALVVLGAYGYFWLNMPEYLTWWKRTVNTLIEKGCDMLRYSEAPMEPLGFAAGGDKHELVRIPQ